MSLHSKAADTLAGVSVIGGIASAVHWFVGDLAPIQVFGIIVGAAAGVMALLAHWKSWRK